METERPVTPASEINEAVRATRLVEVPTQDGRVWTFRIQFVPLIAWDEGGTWLEEIRKGPAAEAAAKMARRIENPSVECMRRVLLRGVVEPRMTDAKADAGAVQVDEFMRKDVTAYSLYCEIAIMSVRDIFPNIEVMADAGTRAAA